MTPTKPAGLSDSAVVLYPGQFFNPGYNVQQNTLFSIMSQIQHADATKQFLYYKALNDWNINNEIYKNLKINNPIPAPVKPKIHTLKIVYADIFGNVVPDAIGSTGMYYCWVEEIEEN